MRCEVYRAHDTTLGRDVAIECCPRCLRGPGAAGALRTRSACARLTESSAHRRHLRRGARGRQPRAGPRAGRRTHARRPVDRTETVTGQTLTGERPGPGDSAGRGRGHRASDGRCPRSSAQKRIVHRDLKPANIKLTPKGVVKVLDFGLAKAFGGDASSPGISPTRRCRCEAPRGTDGSWVNPAYMSPEQARGKSVDKRARTSRAYGCVLFEMLAGRPAFQGETVSDTIALVSAASPIGARCPGRRRPGFDFSCTGSMKKTRIGGSTISRTPGSSSTREATLNPTAPWRQSRRVAESGSHRPRSWPSLRCWPRQSRCGLVVSARPRPKCASRPRRPRRMTCRHWPSRRTGERSSLSAPLAEERNSGSGRWMACRRGRWMEPMAHQPPSGRLTVDRSPFSRTDGSSERTSTVDPCRCWLQQKAGIAPVPGVRRVQFSSVVDRGPPFYIVFRPMAANRPRRYQAAASGGTQLSRVPARRAPFSLSCGRHGGGHLHRRAWSIRPTKTDSRRSGRQSTPHPGICSSCVRARCSLNHSVPSGWSSRASRWCLRSKSTLPTWEWRPCRRPRLAQLSIGPASQPNHSSISFRTTDRARHSSQPPDPISARSLPRSRLTVATWRIPRISRERPATSGCWI